MLPHDSLVDPITAADVVRMVGQGIAQANQTKAAIRLPTSSGTRMVIAVTDRSGEVLGVFRMPDATIFSIDVAIAKARNVAYFADPAQLQAADRIGIETVPVGAALTNRTFRYLGEPRFPEGIDGATPGPFSQLLSGGVNTLNGLQAGPALPFTAFQTAVGFDAFNPNSNFHQPWNVNQNGIVFFPGSTPIYRSPASFQLIGGLGVSGDGVDQDDVVTFAAAQGNQAPGALRADMFFVRGIRLPFQKFLRNPDGI